MTPQEKAKELVDKFSVIGLQQRNEGIACALIAVDELMECSKSYDSYNATWATQIHYWNKVKQELEKL